MKRSIASSWWLKPIEPWQRVFPVTKNRPAVTETEFLSLLASVYQEQLYPTLRADDALTVRAHLDLPTREVERTVRFREDRLFEGEGVYEQFVRQVGPGDVLTLTFHLTQP